MGSKQNGQFRLDVLMRHAPALAIEHGKREGPNAVLLVKQDTLNPGFGLANGQPVRPGDRYRAFAAFGADGTERPDPLNPWYMGAAREAPPIVMEEEPVGILDAIMNGRQPRVVDAETRVPLVVPQHTSPPAAVVTAQVRIVRGIREDIQVLLATLEDVRAEGGPVDVSAIIGTLEAAMDDCYEAVSEVTED